MGDLQVAVFAFVDASGNPVPDERDPFVVTAIVASESILSQFSRRIDRAVANRLGKSLSRVEIHAKDLVQNKGDFRGIPIASRAALLVDMIDTACYYAQRSRLTAISVVVEKAQSFKPRDRTERRGYARSLASEAYKLLFERVIGHLEDKRSRQYLVIIVDETDLSPDITDVLERELLLGAYTSSLRAARRVITPPLFTTSQRYRLLQLADVIAYIIHRVHSGRGDPAGGRFPLTSLYSRINECILRRNKKTGRVEGYGLKLWKYMHHKRRPLA